MTAKILGTEKDPFSVNVLENYAKKYIFHPYISFNIRFYGIKCHLQVLFGARKFFSVLFGGTVFTFLNLFDLLECLVM